MHQFQLVSALQKLMARVYMCVPELVLVLSAQRQVQVISQPHRVIVRHYKNLNRANA